MPFERKCFRHCRNHERLRNRLSGADGQRRVAVRPWNFRGRDEKMPLDSSHSRENALGANLAAADLPGNHIRTRGFEAGVRVCSVISVCLHLYSHWALQQSRTSQNNTRPGSKRKLDGVRFKASSVSELHPIESSDTIEIPRARTKMNVPAGKQETLMRAILALIVSTLFICGAVSAQSPAGGQQQTPPAHQPGVKANPSDSQPQPAQTPAAEKVDTAKEAAIRHLMEITGTSKLGDQIMEVVKSKVHDGMAHRIPAERLPKFMETFD